METSNITPSVYSVHALTLLSEVNIIKCFYMHTEANSQIVHIIEKFWSTNRIPGQPWQHRETLFLKKKKNKEEILIEKILISEIILCF